MAEQLGFEQILGNGSTVDCNEILLRTRTESVQRACQQFLAGTAFPEQQRRHVGRRDFFDHAADREHALTGRNDPIER